MSMTNEEKIKKMNEVKDEYFRRMQVLRDEQARIVRECKERLENMKKEELRKTLNT